LNPSSCSPSAQHIRAPNSLQTATSRHASQANRQTLASAVRQIANAPNAPTPSIPAPNAPRLAPNAQSTEGMPLLQLPPAALRPACSTLSPPTYLSITDSNLPPNTASGFERVDISGSNDDSSIESDIRNLCHSHNRGRDYSGYLPEEANFLRATRLSSGSSDTPDAPEGIEVTLNEFLNRIGHPVNSKDSAKVSE
jgi:hypothetical protein